MTTEPPPAPAQERENVSGRGAFEIAVLGFVIMIVSVVAAGLLLRSAKPGPLMSRATVAIPPKVNGRVEETLIESAASGWARRDDQRRILRRYSWVDRERGVVHIPIDRAIDEFVRQEQERR
jgi:hypothetical protein